MCTVQLPQHVNPIAVNKYVISSKATQEIGLDIPTPAESCPP